MPLQLPPANHDDQSLTVINTRTIGGEKRSILPPPEPSSQLLEYLYVLRANLGWITLVSLLGLGLGWFIGSMRPPIFQAKTVLDIRSLNENFLNPKDGSPVGTTGSVLPESYIQTEIKILSSESLRERALHHMVQAQQDLVVRKPDAAPWWQGLSGHLDPATTPYKKLAADAAERVKVRAVGNTRIVEVLCDARDGQIAADMCNTLAKSYIEYNLESRYKSTKETGEWLQSQLDDVKRRLTIAENDLKDSSKETAFLFDAEGTENPVKEQLHQLQSSLSRSETERINALTEYQIAADRPADSLPMDLDAGPIREYRMRLVELQRQKAELLSTMTPEHYKVRELQMQIDQVAHDLEQERSTALNRLKADYDRARQREAMFASKYKQQAGQMSAQADKTVRFNMLKREVDSERSLYETLLQKVEEVGLQAALHTSAISILDAATPPLKPYSPNVPVTAGIGLLAGFLASLSFSLINVRSDQTIRDPGEAPFHLHLRELGVIPSSKTRRFPLLLNWRRPSPTLKGRSLQALLGGDKDNPLEPNSKSGASSPKTLQNWLKDSNMMEAFFGAVSSLRFLRERGEKANVIVLTSPEAGDGKTTVATNLAVVLAEIGRRVILVDGDIRKPSLAKIFNCDPSKGGLAEILEMTGSIDDIVLEKFVVTTTVPNLVVLPTRAADEGIATKFHSNRTKLLIERLREEYDTVIIDSPPMMRIADARVLGWLADGVLLVLRAGKTTREQALAACECLSQDGTHVFGTILNDWNPRKSDRYYSYRPSKSKLAVVG